MQFILIYIFKREVDREAEWICMGPIIWRQPIEEKVEEDKEGL